MNRVDLLLAVLEVSQNIEQFVQEIRITNPEPCGLEDRTFKGKDSHRGPKVRGKGKKAYRGSL